jgi:hypothetical protein
MKCDECDGEDGPAVIRARLRDYDQSRWVANLCKECKRTLSDDIVIVLNTFDIVPDSLGNRVALPCESDGRPIDEIARSWWDSGFKVCGYVEPPRENFKRFIETLNLTSQQAEVFELLDDEEWLRPMDIGGRDGSHHSNTLAALVRKRLVERKARSSWGTRGSYVYRRVTK